MGDLTGMDTGSSHYTRPVVYLKSNVQITGGTGEVGSEYTLGLIQQ